ncbi:phytanoyl-CoA dioxygenase family protein [Methylobacter sp.]|uniref:phytanoyl-CoA dioxygenase family protein n=1 Tax=Methylobacter sp. TaxID=2051955 RepID=UPI0025FA37F6|nr:phytanoyl-CoA dioxygenase family protein [Methylobacter sp.]
METGELGLLHLRRYWTKRLLEVENRLDQESVTAEYRLDYALMHGLGLGIIEPLEYLFHHRPTYTEFEQWIVQKLGGYPDSTLLERLNEMVRRYLEQSHQTYPIEGKNIEDPVLSADDLAFWQEYGYVVLRNAVSIEDCREAEKAIWNFLGMNPQTPDSWYNGTHQFWVSLFQHPALNKNRASRRIRKAFEQLWGTDDLWATVDRSSLNRPERDGIDISGPSRLHWDVSLALPMPFGIQGLLYLSDTSAEQGAFRCIPGFHRRIDQWLKELGPEQNPREQDLESLGPLAVTGSAGDLVLWHHALPHGSGRNLANYPRVVQYITLFPHDYGVHPIWK